MIESAVFFLVLVVAFVGCSWLWFKDADVMHDPQSREARIEEWREQF